MIIKMNDKSRFNFPLANRRWLRASITTMIAAVVVLVAGALIAGWLQPKGNDENYPVTGDGWTTAPLSEVGMDEKPINELLNRLSRPEGRDISGLVVVKDGKLVFETNYPGDDLIFTDKQSFMRRNFDRDTKHCLTSSSKSVTSIMFGIALDQGKISSVDERLFASLPDYARLSNPFKNQITLRDLLTMTSGLAWDEGTFPYSDSRNNLVEMAFSDDPVEYILEKPMIGKPGETFLYSSGVTNLLGAVINRKTGTPLAEYAAENLFQPLGITDYEWQSFPKVPEMAVASSLLYLKPRDMAKIGQLMLQEGRWEGKQVVSAQWVRESTAASVPLPIDYGPGFQNTGYGYQWWHGKFTKGNTDVFYSSGWGGQFIFIMPGINTVVVMTGSNYDHPYNDMFAIVNTYILGSIIH